MLFAIIQWERNTSMLRNAWVLSCEFSKTDIKFSEEYAHVNGRYRTVYSKVYIGTTSILER